jgi:ketosteroid isomerase-like protein
MNTVQRLWAALATGDWDRAAAEMHPHVIVEWPHTGQRFQNRDAFLAFHTAIPGQRSIEIVRIVTEGRSVASETRISGDEDWSVASFFSLLDGRVLHAVEYWVPSPASGVS